MAKQPNKNQDSRLPRILQDAGVTLLVLALATLVSYVIKQLNGADSNIISIYILAVLVISLFSRGYLFGILTSLACIFLMNFFYTYPFFALNFMLDGYPMTFLAMFLVSVVTSTLVVGTRKNAQLALQKERQAQAMRQEAEQEKMRSNLLRAISHDLRTPLTAISGAAQTILEGGDDLPKERRETMLRNITKDSHWLIRMVENLLSVTHISGGGAQLKKSDELAEEVISGAAAQVRKRYPGCDLTIHDPGDMLFVPMDATLIEQVLINLMENAIKYGGSAEVSYCAVGSSALFTVRDYGPGISPELMPKLFSGGLNSSGSTPINKDADSTRGMGIGLSICHTIVTAHGGEIHAENPADGGALFSFVLPLSTNGNGGAKA